MTDGVRTSRSVAEVVLYLAAQSGGVQGREDVRPVQLVAAASVQLLCSTLIQFLF